MTYFQKTLTFPKTLTALAFIIATSPALAADWTPYLQGMQENCNYGDTITNILTKRSAVPNALKKDVVKQSYANIDEFTNKGMLQLKNASAFGYPINKISFDNEEYETTVTIYFKNKDFMALLPSFYVKLGNTKIPAGSKTAYLKHTYPNKKAKITKMDYKNVGKFSPYQDPNYTDGRWAILYASTPDGWYVTDFEDTIDGELSFNSKTKTITCNTLHI